MLKLTVATTVKGRIWTVFLRSFVNKLRANFGDLIYAD